MVDRATTGLGHPADNKLRYGFILLSAALLVWLGWTGFSAIIICYVLLSILSNLRR